MINYQQLEYMTRRVVIKFEKLMAEVLPDMPIVIIQKPGEDTLHYVITYRDLPDKFPMNITVEMIESFVSENPVITQGDVDDAINYLADMFVIVRETL